MRKTKNLSRIYIICALRKRFFLFIAVPMQAFYFYNNVLNIPTKLETAAVSPQVSKKVLSFLKDSFSIFSKLPLDQKINCTRKFLF